MSSWYNFFRAKRLINKNVKNSDSYSHVKIRFHIIRCWTPDRSLDGGQFCKEFRRVLAQGVLGTIESGLPYAAETDEVDGAVWKIGTAIGAAGVIGEIDPGAAPDYTLGA